MTISSEQSDCLEDSVQSVGGESDFPSRSNVVRGLSRDPARAYGRGDGTEIGG
jgi:hypothetical protein